MKINYKIFSYGIAAIFIVFVAVLMASHFNVKKVRASVADNLSGWAWSETIGWIHFNDANYGVNVAANGAMSGYAWSENIGWISFNENSGCPSAPCQPKMNPGNGEVSGWAKAPAADGNGWDGWIHLRGSNYGVSVSGCDWDGYAWGSDVVGWIHFKGTGYGVVGSGNACQSTPPPAGFSCNSQNQCVFGGGGTSCLTGAGCPGGGGGGGCTSNCGGGGGGGGGCTDPATCPSLSNPDASQLSSDTSFFCPSNQVELKWNYSDPNNDPQNAFRLQVDNNSGFSSMLIDAYKDTSDHLYIIPPNVLAFGTTYYFVVSVKDSTGAWSNWSSAASFYTPSSCAPVSDFGLNKSKDISVNVTGSGNSTSNASQITVTPFSGFAAAVNLLAISISPNLPGISYSLNPPTLNQTQYSSGSAFQATIPGSTIPGNYTITIQGVGGGFTRTVNVILKVNSISSVIREI